MIDEPELSPWRAVRLERVMAAGRTRPLLLECARGSGARQERWRFVIKAIGLPEVQQFTLAHEFLGSRLAQACGLSAPSCEVVELTPEFLAVVAQDLQQSGVRAISGRAVGVAFVPDLIPFPTPAKLTNDEVSQAARIFAFDLMTQNPDRSLTSPNCARVGARVVPYDFESAFSFRFAIGNEAPWLVSGLPFVRRHLFFDELSHADVEWESLMVDLSTSVQASFSNVCSTIPNEWREIGEDVRAHIAAVLEHWSEFVHEVVNSLRIRL